MHLAHSIKLDARRREDGAQQICLFIYKLWTDSRAKNITHKLQFAQQETAKLPQVQTEGWITCLGPKL